VTSVNWGTVRRWRHVLRAFQGVLVRLMLRW